MVVDVPMILADSIGVSNLTELKCGGKKDTAEDMAGRKIRRKKDMRYGGKRYSLFLEHAPRTFSLWYGSLAIAIASVSPSPRTFNYLLHAIACVSPY